MVQNTHTERFGESPSDSSDLGELLDTDTPRKQVGPGSFTAPLGKIERARLVFTSGTTGVTICANPNLSELYSASFYEQIPSIRVQNGIITIHFRRHAHTSRLANARQPSAYIMLNKTIPWEIEFRDGLSHLNADLSALHLSALDMTSVSTAYLQLPAPTGIANIYLSGSASALTLGRPIGVPLRLQIMGAASQLNLDGQQIGTSSSGLRWQSSSDYSHTGRYDVAIAGSVSNLTIVEVS